MVLYALSYPLSFLLGGLGYYLSLGLSLFVLLFLGLVLCFGLIVLKIGLLASIQDLERGGASTWASFSMFISLVAVLILLYQGFYRSEDLVWAYGGLVYEAGGLGDLPSNPEAYYFFVYPQVLEPNLACSRSKTITRTSKHRSGGGTTVSYHLQLYGLDRFDGVFLSLVDAPKLEPRSGLYFRRQLKFRSEFESMICSGRGSAAHFWQVMDESPEVFRWGILRVYLAWLFYSAVFALLLAWSNAYVGEGS